jgi:hypothetical protein
MSATNGSSPEQPPAFIWDFVDRAIARAPTVADLAAHRLGPLATRRYRVLGRPLPPELDELERLTMARTLAAPVILRRIRAACTGPIVLVKGPETAAHYPDPALRLYGDLDIVVPRPDEVQAALFADGFVEHAGPTSVATRYHLRPLWLPELPLKIEVHRELNWPRGLDRPAIDLFAETTPSATRVEGISTLPRSTLAILTAGHAWAHAPLATLGELLDVALLALGIDDGVLSAAARRWGLGRIWATTLRAIDSQILASRPRALPERLWARHLPAVRERTVFEAHVEDLLSPLWALPVGRASREIARTVIETPLPLAEERWSTKLLRSRSALRHAFVRKSAHDSTLGPGADDARD